jgi:hypothetical protein
MTPVRTQGVLVAEILIGALILLLLAGIVWIMSRPPDLGVVRDAERRHHLELISGAIYQYAIRNGGAFPESVPEGQPKELCRSDVPCNGGVDLSEVVGSGSTIDTVPVDPQATGTGSDYTIALVGKKIVVCAPNTEKSAEMICLAR